MNSEGDIDKIFDQGWYNVTLDICVKEQGRVDVDLQQLWIELVIKHEIIAENFEAAKLLIETVFCLQECEPHYFVDSVCHSKFELVY